MSATTITYRGLSGVRITLNVDTTDSLTTITNAAIADEGLNANYYADFFLLRDDSIKRTSNGGSTYADLGLTTADELVAVLADNPATFTKEQRQVRKLEIAQLKRRGGPDADTGANFYREFNTYDINALSLKYAGEVRGNDAETYNPLLPRRPWITGGAGAIPDTVEEAVAEATLERLQTNYDASTNTYIKPASLSSGGTITQWLDQSVFAHNLNSGGSARPIWVDNVKNSLGVLRFDGVNDCLNINPVAWLNSVPQATFFVVCKPTATTGDNAMGSDQGDLRIYSDTGKWKVGMAGVTAGETGLDTNANITANNWYYMSVIYNGTAGTDADRLKFRVNGQAITLSYSGTVGATTNSANTKFEVGCYNGTQFFAGDISEVLVFDTLLITPEVNGIESYLSAKWGI